MRIKDLVKENTVNFNRYRQGIAYYLVEDPEDGARYEFPVPLDDVGDATLLHRDKAIYFMRYIRKAIKEQTLIVCQ